MGIAMMAVMHVYFHFTQPLFIQGLMGIKNLYDAKPVKIYIFGQKAEGDLKRPFKAASMFGRASRFLFTSISQLTSRPAATGPQTDAAAIAEAEKRVGKKEE